MSALHDESSVDQDQSRAVRFTLLLTGTMTIMAGATISPALPALADHFQASPNVAYLSRLLITLPSLVIAIFAPLAGLVIDRFGRKRLLIAGITLYGFAGSAGVMLDTLPGILASRALLGLAVAAVMTVSSTLMGDYFSGRVRERFMGFRQGFIQYGGVVFLTLGGILATLDWRAPFLVYLLAFAILPLAIFFLFEPDSSQIASERNAKDATKPPYLMIGMLYGIGIVHSMSNCTAANARAKCSEYYGHACPPLPQLMAYNHGPHSHGLHSCGLHRTRSHTCRPYPLLMAYILMAHIVMGYIVMGYSEPQPRLSAASHNLWHIQLWPTKSWPSQLWAIANRSLACPRRPGTNIPFFLPCRPLPQLVA